LGKRLDGVAEKVWVGIVENLDQFKVPLFDPEIDDLGEVAGTEKGDLTASRFSKLAANPGALSARFVIELHREVEELVSEPRLFRDSLGGEEIIPASGVVLTNMQRSALDHLAQQFMGELDTTAKLARGHAVVQPRRLFHLPEEFQLEQVVSFEDWRHGKILTEGNKENEGEIESVFFKLIDSLLTSLASVQISHTVSGMTAQEPESFLRQILLPFHDISFRKPYHRRQRREQRE